MGGNGGRARHKKSSTSLAPVIPSGQKIGKSTDGDDRDFRIAQDEDSVDLSELFDDVSSRLDDLSESSFFSSLLLKPLKVAMTFLRGARL